MGKVVDDVMPPEQYGGGRAKEEGDDGAEKKKAEKEKQNEKFPFEALAALFVVGAAASFLRVTLLTVATQVCCHVGCIAELPSEGYFSCPPCS